MIDDFELSFESGERLRGRFLITRLIDPNRQTLIPTTPANVGMILALRAAGPGDETPVEATIAVEGRAILPPSPVHGTISATGAGDLVLRWTRRSRLGWDWRDLGEVPLAEEREAYRLAIKAGDVILREAEVVEPS